MKVFSLCVFLAAAVGLAEAAAIVPGNCQPATLDTYMARGELGCNIGPGGTFDFNFNNFRFSANGSGGASLLNASQILVTPTFNGQTIGLNFSSMLSDGSPGFNVNSGQSASYTIGYTADPPPPEIIRFDDALNNDPATGNATTTIGTTFCMDPACERVGSVSLFDSSDGMKLHDSFNIKPSTVFLQVTNNITLDATNDGSANFTSFDNVVGLQGLVPEPASAGLVIVGLLGLAAVRRRRAKLG